MYFFSFILQFIIIKQVPYQKDTVANIRYAVEQFVFIFHNLQVHIINLFPKIPYLKWRFGSLQVSEI
jgi:hypothetical protein